MCSFIFFLINLTINLRYWFFSTSFWFHWYFSIFLFSIKFSYVIFKGRSRSHWFMVFSFFEICSFSGINFHSNYCCSFLSQIFMSCVFIFIQFKILIWWWNIIQCYQGNVLSRHDKTWKNLEARAGKKKGKRDINCVLQISEICALIMHLPL